MLNKTIKNNNMSKKTLFIIGGVIFALGVIMLIFGNKFMGYGFIGLAVAFEAIALVSMALISESKKATEGSEDNFDVRLNNAITKVRQDKFKAEGDIRRIKTWANDAILEAFSEFYPVGTLAIQRDTLFEKFDQLKLEHQEKLTFEMTEKLDKVVVGYKNQIGIKESQMQLLEKLHVEYSDTKKKFEAVKAKEKKMNSLDKHDKRLQELENNTDLMANSIEHQYKLEDVKKEFELKEAYITQLEQLQYQYGDESKSSNALAYKDELDKMIVKVNSAG